MSIGGGNVVSYLSPRILPHAVSYPPMSYCIKMRPHCTVSCPVLASYDLAPYHFICSPFLIWHAISYDAHDIAPHHKWADRFGSGRIMPHDSASSGRTMSSIFWACSVVSNPTVESHIPSHRSVAYQATAYHAVSYRTMCYQTKPSPIWSFPFFPPHIKRCCMMPSHARAEHMQSHQMGHTTMSQALYRSSIRPDLISSQFVYTWLHHIASHHPIWTHLKQHHIVSRHSIQCIPNHFISFCQIFNLTMSLIVV